MKLRKREIRKEKITPRMNQKGQNPLHFLLFQFRFHNQNLSELLSYFLKLRKREIRKSCLLSERKRTKSTSLPPVLVSFIQSKFPNQFLRLTTRGITWDKIACRVKVNPKKFLPSCQFRAWTKNSGSDFSMRPYAICKAYHSNALEPRTLRRHCEEGK